MKLIENIYSKLLSAAGVDKKLMEWFRITVGAREGCTLLPDLFHLVLEVERAVALGGEMGGVTLYGRTESNL